MACNANIQLTGYWLYLIFDCQAGIPVDLILWSSTTVSTSSSVYSTILRRFLTTAYILARQKMSAQLQRQNSFMTMKFMTYHIANVEDLKWLLPLPCLLVSLRSYTIHGGLSHSKLSSIYGTLLWTKFTILYIYSYTVYSYNYIHIHLVAIFC